jgi:hypothetical protein
MLSGFEQWWGSLVASWGERTVLGAFAFLSYLVSWAVCNIPYFYIDYYNLFTQYKLQPVRLNKNQFSNFESPFPNLP